MFHPTDLFHGIFNPAFFGTGTNLSLSSWRERDVGYLCQKPTRDTQANKEVASATRREILQDHLFRGNGLFDHLRSPACFPDRKRTHFSQLNHATTLYHHVFGQRSAYHGMDDFECSSGSTARQQISRQSCGRGYITETKFSVPVSLRSSRLTRFS